MSQMAPRAADAPGIRNFVTRALGDHVVSEPSEGTRTTKKAACLTQVTVSTPWERSVFFCNLQDTRCSPLVQPSLCGI